MFLPFLQHLGSCSSLEESSLSDSDISLSDDDDLELELDDEYSQCFLLFLCFLTFFGFCFFHLSLLSETFNKSCIESSNGKPAITFVLKSLVKIIGLTF